MVNILMTRTDNPNSKSIIDGQVIFDTSGNGKMYLDNGTTRLEMGGAIDVDATLDATSTNPIQNKGVAGVMLGELEEIRGTTKKGFLTDALATKTLDAKITELNGKLGNIYISDITAAINTDYVDGSIYVYSTNRTIRVIAKLTAKEDIPAWTHIINNLGWSGINIYFHDVNNQIGINWNGNYMQNTIVVSKNNTFNIDIEGIV